MGTSSAVLVAATLIAAPVAVGAQEKAALAEMPSTLTRTQIAAHNAALAPADPDYIKCRKVLETGSLVKKYRVCRTNAKWREVIANSSQNARATVEAMSSKASGASYMLGSD
ncbi:hypothetical protein [Sphingopyxis solisilvae]|uniref:hypothetical protein n=1 Tax=Sphingopyxis solisilvae TaxID=1886788 RepID=UPI004036DA3F